METLKQKLVALLELQEKIDEQKEKMEEELKKLEEQKEAMVSEYNAPIKQCIVDSISSFLVQELVESGEDKLDISDVDINIETGEYDDLNTGGGEGEIVYEVESLMFADDVQTVLVGYRDYCGGYDWGRHSEKLTRRLSVLRRIANYLTQHYGLEFEYSPDELVFVGDRRYYQRQLKNLED